MILVKPDSEAGARPSKARPLINDLHRWTAWVTLRDGRGASSSAGTRRVAPDFEAGLASLMGAAEA